MPDIMIRGMEMPKSCSQCPIFNFDYDICNDLSTHNRDFETSRIDGCPLHELPEHGELIDRDALPEGRLEWEDIDDAPVIVPSNKEDSRTMDEFMCGQECGNPEDGSL